MIDKKEAKIAYKQMKFRMGVFQIKNLKNDKVFLSSAIDIDSKWNRLKMELRFDSHKNPHLQKDWNTEGEENFVFEVLSILEQNDNEVRNYQKELRTMEKDLLNKLRQSEIICYNS